MTDTSTKQDMQSKAEKVSPTNQDEPKRNNRKRNRRDSKNLERDSDLSLIHI